MTTMERRGSWKICVYGAEHGVPHFHVEGHGFRCSVGIDTLHIIIGSAPSSVLREALAWAGQNQSNLRNEWHRLNG